MSKIFFRRTRLHIWIYKMHLLLVLLLVLLLLFSHKMHRFEWKLRGNCHWQNEKGNTLLKWWRKRTRIEKIRAKNSILYNLYSIRNNFRYYFFFSFFPESINSFHSLLLFIYFFLFFPFCFDFIMNLMWRTHCTSDPCNAWFFIVHRQEKIDSKVSGLQMTENIHNCIRRPQTLHFHSKEEEEKTKSRVNKQNRKLKTIFWSAWNEMNRSFSVENQRIHKELVRFFFIIPV